jgi:hypothetical protein
METFSVVLYGLPALAVLCFVLDRWVLPKDRNPSAPDREKSAESFDKSEDAAIRRRLDLEWERDRLIRLRKDSPFQVNAFVDSRDDVRSLSISCSGKIPWHESSRQFVTLCLEDVTDSDPKPIRCSDPSLSEAGTGDCLFSPDVVLPSDELIAGFFRLVKVPLSALTAPYAGRRKVRIGWAIGPRGSVPEDVSKRSEIFIDVDLFNAGYDDVLGRGRVAVCKMELAIACGLAGRSRLGPALEVLSSWVDQVLDLAKQDDASRFPALRDALDHLWSEGLPEDYGVEKACASIAASGRRAVDDAMELCLRMSTADEAWPMPAVQLLRRIAALMGLSTSECQAMFDRHLLGSTVRAEACDWESVVGLNPALEPQEIRKHLAAQFDRWNSRAPNARTTTEQARIRTILETIAKLKQKYA